MFTERYVRALDTSDLRDDEHHHATDALIAAALADKSGGSDEVLGSLLTRVKYADGSISKLFESGTTNLAALLNIWKAVVRKKGRERDWLRPRTEWDLKAHILLCEKVALASLAHWLGGHCGDCNGAGVTRERRTCGCCKGTGKEPIEGGRLEVELTKDMLSELEGMYQSHGARAAKKLRAVT